MVNYKIITACKYIGSTRNKPSINEWEAVATAGWTASVVFTDDSNWFGEAKTIKHGVVASYSSYVILYMYNSYCK